MWKGKKFENRIDCFPPRLVTDIALALNFPSLEVRKQSITQKTTEEIFDPDFFAFQYSVEGNEAKSIVAIIFKLLSGAIWWGGYRELFI
jgi:hypothetical protein